MWKDEIDGNPGEFLENREGLVWKEERNWNAVTVRVCPLGAVSCTEFRTSRE